MGELTLGAKLLGFFKGLPSWVYIALAVAALIGAGAFMHHRAVKSAYTAAYNQGVQDTKDAFARAQAKADAAQRAKNAVTAQGQNKISQEKDHALTRAYDSIDARARAISLHHEAAARRSQGGLNAVPASSDTATGACPATAEDGLSWSVAFPLMVQAARDEAQLNAILDWEDAQARLDAKTRAPDDPTHPQE